MGVTRNKYYVLPNSATGHHVLSDGELKNSDGSGLNLTGYEKVYEVSSTGLYHLWDNIILQ